MFLLSLLWRQSLLKEKKAHHAGHNSTGSIAELADSIDSLLASV